jgi:putative SOS response-associated peptidase YedK
LCGRYFIEIDEKELRDIVDAAEKNMKEEQYGQLTFKTSGEIFPTDIVPAQTGPGQYRFMRWGFVAHDGKPVINARSETALEKPMFQKPMRERRCIIPASGYYEWRKDGGNKTKHQFFIPGSPMFLAGCWRQEKNSPIHTFVILTKPASGSAEAIHDRMPVIIPRSRIGEWLNESPDAMKEAVTDIEFKEIGA